MSSQTEGLFIPHSKVTAEALADSSHPKTTTKVLRRKSEHDREEGTRRRDRDECMTNSSVIWKFILH
jgi:hypothetical protein